jgi:hypothetical protein
MIRSIVLWTALVVPSVSADGWTQLFNGKSLDGWEAVGDGVWTILAEGTLVGQRNPGNPPFENDTLTTQKYRGWVNVQAWLYTRREFGDFDLELEYWLRTKGNSGISLRDPSRGKYGVAMPPDFTKTPSKLGYEIQLNNQYPDQHASGSIYTFTKAPTGAQIDNQWNRLRIESRANLIRVLINGKLVSEHPGDPKRPVRGPIGLQLHDQFSVVMFRNIRIRELNVTPADRVSPGHARR